MLQPTHIGYSQQEEQDDTNVDSEEDEDNKDEFDDENMLYYNAEY